MSSFSRKFSYANYMFMGVFSDNYWNRMLIILKFMLIVTLIPLKDLKEN